MGLIALTVLLGVTASGASAAAADKKKAAARCDGTSGWSSVVGRPTTLAAGSALGLYVWNQKGTWVVAATGPDRKQKLFQGVVSFDLPIAAKPVGLEGRSDVVAVGLNAVAFTFKNFGRLDSVAVNAPCATTVTINGTVDGVALTSQQIFIGASATNPTAAPAVVRRDSSSASTVSASVPSDPAACATAAWPANTVGRPSAFRARRQAGFHLWNEKSSGGWQALAVADLGRPQLFEGRITANAPVVFQPLGLEGRDAVKVDATTNTISFSFRTNRTGDGFLFFAPCASQLVIEVSVDGVELEGADVLVGPAAQPAPVMPLTITR